MVHITFMTRGVANLVVLALVGCVGENPDWDRRTTDTQGSSTDAADMQAVPSGSSADAADTQALPSTESSATDSNDPEGSSGGTSTEPGTSEGPSCPPPAQICNGVCSEIWRDKHACGSECIDCTELHGNDAKCNEGDCEPHGGDDDDDDD